MATPAQETTFEVTPPHNREAEEGVIGSVLIDAETFHACRVRICSSEEFYIHRHRWIWDAFEKMVKEKIPIDLKTLADTLDNLGMLAEIGGPAYLTGIVSNVPSAINAPAYAKIVHDHYTRRRMITSANDIAAVAYDESTPVEECASRATHSLSNAVASATNPHAHEISESVSRVYDLVDERSKSGVMPGIPTGLVDLDNLLGGGAQNSDLWLIAARPGEGKTSLLLQFLRNAASYKMSQKVYRKRVALFSLEMPEEQIVLRLLSQMTNIDFQLLRSGKLRESDWPVFTNAVEELGNLDILIDDTRGVSPAYIRSRCEIWNAEGKLDEVFVDSLNLMKSGLNFKRTDQEVDYNATELFNLAGELNIPIWCAHQMNRNKENRGFNSRPTLADLREGGEQPASGVLFIYHEHDKDNPKKINNSELIIAKQRNGPTDNVCVVFRGAQTKFESAFKIRGSDD